jgi:hypothetical protein
MWLQFYLKCYSQLRAFIHAPGVLRGNLVDIDREIFLMNTLQRPLNSGLSYSAGGFCKTVRQAWGVLAVPLVLLGETP